MYPVNNSVAELLKDGLVLPPSLGLLPGEFVKVLGETGEESAGIIALTNYRLLVIPKCLPPDSTTKLNVTLPLNLIDGVENRDFFYFCVSCKDGRVYRVPLETTSDCEEWCKRIQRAALVPPEKAEMVFAFAHFAWRKELLPPDSPSQAAAAAKSASGDDWFHSEISRLRFDRQNAWRVTQINKDFKFCATYPEELLIPNSVTDETLEKVGNFRSAKRIPSVVWRNVQNGAVLARSSQPEVGWLGWRCKEDEELIQSIANAAAFDEGGGTETTTTNDSVNWDDGHGGNGSAGCGDSMSLKDLSHEASKMGVGRKVLILDARSYTAAVGNRARGGGVECEDYYSNTEILFMNLVNIHAIRKSFIQLRQLCGSSSVGMDSSSWFQTLDNTKWLPQIGSLMKAAIRCVDALEIEGRVVLVHCSDGWDRTPQITSLAQLMLDPYYRSMDGFQVLVKKEWLDYGHKMADRCGNPFATSDANERSPIFLQWLDCVHQLLLQYPTHFEFNQGFLIKLARHTYSNLFGNFLCNSLMERKKNHVQEQTRSIWSFLRSDNQAKYLNLLYNKLEDTLRPKTEVRDFLLWREVFTAEQHGSACSGIDSIGSSKTGSASEGSSSAANSSRDESEERREQTNGKLSPSSQPVSYHIRPIETRKGV